MKPTELAALAVGAAATQVANGALPHDVVGWITLLIAVLSAYLSWRKSQP